MTQTIVDLGENENRILNIVKAKFGFKNKSDAVNFIIEEYAEESLEPQLRPEFIEKMKKRSKEPAVEVKDFKKHYGLK